MSSKAQAVWLDKQAIMEVLYVYCRALDRMDMPMALSIWDDAATVDYGSIYRGPYAGLLDAAWAIHNTMTAHSHQVTNILIEVDGDQAASEAYYIAALRQNESDRVLQITSRGRYLDRWQRNRDRWLISHRTVASDFTDIREVKDSEFAANGRRDRSDPSYAFLRGEK